MGKGSTPPSQQYMPGGAKHARRASRRNWRGEHRPGETPATRNPPPAAQRGTQRGAQHWARGAWDAWDAWDAPG